MWHKKRWCIKKIDKPEMESVTESFGRQRETWQPWLCQGVHCYPEWVQMRTDTVYCPNTRIYAQQLVVMFLSKAELLTDPNITVLIFLRMETHSSGEEGRARKTWKANETSGTQEAQNDFKAPHHCHCTSRKHCHEERKRFFRRASYRLGWELWRSNFMSCHP